MHIDVFCLWSIKYLLMHRNKIDFYDLSFPWFSQCFTQFHFSIVFVYLNKHGATMRRLIPKYHTCGQTKERTLPLWKTLNVSEGDFCSSSRMGTCNYTKVLPDCEQGSIRSFLPTVCGELPRSMVFNQLANKTCEDRRAEKGSCNGSPRVVSAWQTRSTKVKEWSVLSKTQRSKKRSHD